MAESVERLREGSIKTRIETNVLDRMIMQFPEFKRRFH